MTLLLSPKCEACIHCGDRLRANGLLRNTPCGRSIVFDPARSRVWIVCDHCDGWNLTPLETRVDALEECERVFSNAVLRDTSGGVDRAKVGKVEFVRIGSIEDDGLPLFHYAARIRRREWLKKGLGYSFMGVFMGGPTALMLWNNTNPIASFGVLIGLIMVARTFFRRSIVMRVRDEHGVFHTVRKGDLSTLTLVRGQQAGTWWLSLTTTNGHAHLAGDDALRALRVALAVTLLDIPPDVFAEASRFLRDARFSSPTDVFAAVAQETTNDGSKRSLWGMARPGSVYFLPLYQRVALEIASTEALDRAAALEDARRVTAGLSESETIAQIADSMFLPAAALPVRHKNER